MRQRVKTALDVVIRTLRITAIILSFVFKKKSVMMAMMIIPSYTTDYYTFKVT